MELNELAKGNVGSLIKLWCSIISERLLDLLTCELTCCPGVRILRPSQSGFGGVSHSDGTGCNALIILRHDHAGLGSMHF